MSQFDDDRGPRELSASLDAVIRQLGGPSSSSATLKGVFGRWREVVGDAIADNAQPVSIRDGRLVVSVEQPGWATQLRFMESTMVERIAQAVGAGVVTSIEVRVRKR